jgi:antitoxin component YwqK of YwqJK toxin-antitoxin module
MTEDYVYHGSFENGKKHGFGEEFYPKTGLRLKGCFKNGEFQSLDKYKVALPDSTSEAQLVIKP